MSTRRSTRQQQPQNELTATLVDIFGINKNSAIIMLTALTKLSLKQYNNEQKLNYMKHSNGFQDLVELVKKERSDAMEPIVGTNNCFDSRHQGLMREKGQIIFCLLNHFQNKDLDPDFEKHLLSLLHNILEADERLAVDAKHVSCGREYGSACWAKFKRRVSIFKMIGQAIPVDQRRQVLEQSQKMNTGKSLSIADKWNKEEFIENGSGFLDTQEAMERAVQQVLKGVPKEVEKKKRRPLCDDDDDVGTQHCNKKQLRQPSTAAKDASSSSSLASVINVDVCGEFDTSSVGNMLDDDDNTVSPDTITTTRQNINIEKNMSVDKNDTEPNNRSGALIGGIGTSSSTDNSLIGKLKKVELFYFGHVQHGCIAERKAKVEQFKRESMQSLDSLLAEIDP